MKVHLAGPLGEADWENVPAEKVVDGAPATRTWVRYEEAGGRLAAGVWEARPGTWRIAYDEWEYVLVEFGRCVLAGDDGSRIEAGPGDAFVIEPGFRGTWEVLETMRKHWVIETR